MKKDVNQKILIYKITNTLNNKVYIGQTIHYLFPLKRINAHFKKAGNGVDLVYRAFKKYGKDIFSIDLIATALDLHTGNELEKFFIKHFNSLVPIGYNIREGGLNGGKLPKEIIEKIANKNRGKPSKLKGVPKSVEHKQNMSKSRKGFDTNNRKIARKLYMHGHNNISIKAININTNKSYIFKNITECAKVLNLSASCISRTVRNIQNRTQHKGYKFEIVDKRPKTE